MYSNETPNQWPEELPKFYESEKVLYVRFTPYMPDEMMHRFITSIYAQWDETTPIDQLPTAVVNVWRTGAVVEMLGQTVLVRSTIDGIIEIRVRVRKGRDDYQKEKGFQAMNQTYNCLVQAARGLVGVEFSKWYLNTNTDNVAHVCLFDVPNSSSSPDQHCRIGCYKALPADLIRDVSGLEPAKATYPSKSDQIIAVLSL